MSKTDEKKQAKVTRSEAHKLLTLGGRKTSKDEVDRFLKEVEAGTPVMPVSFFCSFLEEWASVYGRPVPEERGPNDNAERQALAEKARFVFLQIRKSNFLWRRIYRGEPTRLVPCPSHKGRWSGCKLPEDTECKGACMYGSDVTGWLP